jgi:hypothetical protein
MASSPTDPAASPRRFALQELIVCWNQAYEALANGDLDRVAALLDVTDGHVRVAGIGAPDDATESSLRSEALSAKGRLEHAMKAGLQGMREELARTRVGGKALRGYAQGGKSSPESISRQA